MDPFTTAARGKGKGKAPRPDQFDREHAPELRNQRNKRLHSIAYSDLQRSAKELLEHLDPNVSLLDPTIIGRNLEEDEERILLHANLADSTHVLLDELEMATGKRDKASMRIRQEIQDGLTSIFPQVECRLTKMNTRQEDLINKLVQESSELTIENGKLREAVGTAAGATEMTAQLKEFLSTTFQAEKSDTSAVELREKTKQLHDLQLQLERANNDWKLEENNFIHTIGNCEAEVGRAEREKKAMDSRIQTLTEDLRALQSQCDAARQENRSDLSRHKEELDGHARQINEREARLTAAEARADDLDKKTNNLEFQLTLRQSEIDELNRQLAAALQPRNMDTNGKLVNEIFILKMEKSGWDKKTASLKNDLKTAEESRRTSSETHKATINDLTQKLNDEQAAKMELENQLEDANRDNETYAELYDDQKEKEEAIQQKLQKSEADIELLHDAIEEFRYIETSLTQKRDFWEKTANTYMEDLQKEMNHNTDLRKTNESLRSELTELGERAMSSKERWKKDEAALRNSNTDLEKEIQALKYEKAERATEKNAFLTKQQAAADQITQILTATAFPISPSPHGSRRSSSASESSTNLRSLVDDPIRQSLGSDHSSPYTPANASRSSMGPPIRRSSVSSHTPYISPYGRESSTRIPNTPYASPHPREYPVRRPQIPSERTNITPGPQVGGPSTGLHQFSSMNDATIGSGERSGSPGSVGPIVGTQGHPGGFYQAPPRYGSHHDAQISGDHAQSGQRMGGLQQTTYNPWSESTQHPSVPRALQPATTPNMQTPTQIFTAPPGGFTGVRSYRFLVDGPPSSGRSVLDGVSRDLVSKMDAQIQRWDRMQPNGWSKISRKKSVRCVETRVSRISTTVNPVPADPHHSFACRACTQRRHICVVVGPDSSPVAVPLSHDQRPANVTPWDLAYYVRDQKIQTG